MSTYVERAPQRVHSQRKGKRGELEVVAILRRSGWPNAERTSRGCRQMGIGDIQGGPEAVHIEIKRKKTIDICASLDQIQRDCPRTSLPLIVHRADGFEWLATMPVADWKPLRELWQGDCEVLTIPEYHRISVCRTLKGMAASCPSGRLPVLVHKPAIRHPWVTTLRLEALLPLLLLGERG